MNYDSWGMTKAKLVKGKAIPLHVWRGREVSRIFRIPDFKTIDT
jgi:hypothetical protein